MHVQERIFSIEKSFWFAVLVPDDTVGCSGSRCANCGNSLAYCDQFCPQCQFPLVGPFELPQYPEWEKFCVGQRVSKVERIFFSRGHGRIEHGNVESIPLTIVELENFNRLPQRQKDRTLGAYGIQDLGKILRPHDSLPMS
jgi:hypothetical protein